MINTGVQQIKPKTFLSPIERRKTRSGITLDKFGSNNVFLEISPAKGATVHSAVVNGINLIDSPVSRNEEIDRFSPSTTRGNFLLGPACRIEDGICKSNNELIDLDSVPRNEWPVKDVHRIHGPIGYSDKWKQVLAIRKNGTLAAESNISVKYCLDTKDVNPLKSFGHFLYEVQYTLAPTETGGIFETYYKAENLGDKESPFYLGAHPFLNLPNIGEDWKMHFEAEYIVEEKNNLPTGNLIKTKKSDKLDFNGHGQNLTSDLDQPYFGLKADRDGLFRVDFTNFNSGIKIHHLQSVDMFPFFQIFYQKNKCISTEPLPWAPNALNLFFRDKENWAKPQMVPPGEFKEGISRIEVFHS